MFNAPAFPPNGDPRTPEIIVTPNVGVIYTGHQAKVAGHGGFANDDTNVIMLLSNPHFKAKTVVSPVETTQVAPTILAALGLDPNDLQAVQIEHTQVLPEVPFSSGQLDRIVRSGILLPLRSESFNQGGRGRSILAAPAALYTLIKPSTLPLERGRPGNTRSICASENCMCERSTVAIGSRKSVVTARSRSW